jgi:hypothetical protein
MDAILSFTGMQEAAFDDLMARTLTTGDANGRTAVDGELG